MEFTQDRDVNENIFRLVVAVLEALEDTDAPAGAPARLEPVARYFETWLMRFEGLMPNYNLCSRCGGDVRGQPTRFFLERLEVLCQKCAPSGGVPVSTELKEAVDKIFRHNPAQFGRLPLDAKGLGDLELLNQRLLARHLGRNPRSFATIKQLKRIGAGSS
jgi:recombinational DNA repair protein (RecF pathway)